MTSRKALNLGPWRYLDDRPGSKSLKLPADHLVTHGVVVGMTGSGKTGLVMVMIEETLSAGIPTIVVDVKGDLPNLMLAFPSFDPAAYLPWLEPSPEGAPPHQLAERAALVAADRRNALAEHRISEKN
jgi:DNA helicase HerA-like ATPase